MSDSTMLEGKCAVVTGGGRGIGEAIALELAALGARVLVSARSVNEIEGVASRLREAGHEAFAVPCDVVDPQQVERLAGRAKELMGGLDILVNNAGISSSAPLKRTSLDEWNRIFAVNVTGTFLCTKAMLPPMLEGGWGRIVNVASVAGLSGAAYISAYAASKHAVVGFTRCVAAEVATAGVTVNAVCPGFVATEMVAESVQRIMAKTGASEEKARSGLAQMNPQGRILEPEEVALQVAHLCDPRARGINGQCLVLDGGGLLA